MYLLLASFLTCLCVCAYRQQVDSKRRGQSLARYSTLCETTTTANILPVSTRRLRLPHILLLLLLLQQRKAYFIQTMHARMRTRGQNSGIKTIIALVETIYYLMTNQHLSDLSLIRCSNVYYVHGYIFQRSICQLTPIKI